MTVYYAEPCNELERHINALGQHNYFSRNVMVAVKSRLRDTKSDLNDPEIQTQIPRSRD